MNRNKASRRFDVSLAQRLEQSRHATNSYRLGKLGYSMWRVYDSNYPSDEQVLIKTRYGNMWIQRTLLGHSVEPRYTVKWLKEKHVMVLRLKGYRVTPAKTDDRTTKVGL